MSETFFQVVETGDVRKIIDFVGGCDPTAPFVLNINVNEVNMEGYSLLHWAIKRVNPVKPCSDLCKLLISLGANLNTCEYMNGNTPLHDVCDPATAAVLIQFGADPTRQNKFGLMPIEVISGRFDGFTENYLANFTPNYVSRGARSLWHAGNDLNFMQHILQFGGINNSPLDPNLRDETGLTPLHFNVKRGRRRETIQLLARFGASLDVTDSAGNTPLHDAPDVETISTLIAIIMERDTQPFYPLMSKLLSNRNNYGLTPLESVTQDSETRKDVANYLKDICEQFSIYSQTHSQQTSDTTANSHSKKRAPQDEDELINSDFIDYTPANLGLKRSNTWQKRQRKIALDG